VRQVRLPKVCVLIATEFLRRAGIDGLSTFPDYEGFARSIRDGYEIVADR
jgi:hypothetical protein